MKNKKNIRIIWAALIITLFLFSGIFISYAAKPGGKLVYYKGEVFVSNNEGQTWVNVDQKMILPEGACIRVGKDSQAALLLTDHSQIRLREGSVLCLKKSGSEPGDAKGEGGVANLLSGNLWFRNKRDGAKPLFQTPVVTASIRGTEMALSVDETGKTEVTVLEGHVLTANEYGQATVSRGEGSVTQKGKAPEIVTLLHPEGKVQWLLLTPDIVGPADASVEKLENKQILGIKNAKEAMRELSAGDLAKAYLTASEAVKLAPDRAAANVAMATVLQTKGDFEKGLEYAGKGLSQDPQSVPAVLRTVELMLGLDKLKNALAAIDGFKGEADPRIDMLKGFMALIGTEVEKAEADFRSAIEKSQDLSDAYLGLGLALYRQNKKTEALESMEYASLVNPLAAYPHYYLGKAQYELGERDEAEIEIKRALELDPNDPTPYMYLATIMADRFRPGEGIMALEKAIGINDNKLMTRSRYLLDQDRAAKNVSLARSLSQMGLHEWANSRGNLAVWDDPSNSGAYLFRALEAVGLNTRGAGTLGDLKRTKLLQPVNANTYTTYSDYQNLLEIPETKGQLSFLGGTDESYTGDVSVWGGTNKVAYFVEGGYSTTDGPVDGSGKDSGSGLARAKVELLPGHELIGEFQTVKSEYEDLTPWQDYFQVPKDEDYETEFYSGMLGYHWRQGPGRDLLTSFQYNNKGYDDELHSDPTQLYCITTGCGYYQYDTFNQSDSDTARIEALELFRFRDHHFSIGGVYSKSSYDPDYLIRQFTYFQDKNNILSQKTTAITDGGDDIKESRVFAGDIFKITDQFSIDAGVSWAKFENLWRNDRNEIEDKDEVMPQFGIMFQSSEKDILRAAYFHELQPDFLSGSLQPMEVAGFSKVTGVIPGTYTKYFGLGWDRNWNEKTFTRLEGFYLDREYPTGFSSHPDRDSWKKETQHGAKLAFERLINEQWAFAVNMRVTQVEPENPDRERIDYDFSTRLTWAHPTGWRAQAALWYMNQDEKDGFDPEIGDDFFIASFSVEKSLWDKNALIFFKWVNMTDEEYTYLILEAADAQQLPWQGSFIQAGFQWNF